MSTPEKKPKAQLLGLFVIALLIFTVVAGIYLSRAPMLSSNAATQQGAYYVPPGGSTAAIAPAPETSVSVPSVPAPETAAPVVPKESIPHNYVLEDDGQYGYERPVSDTDAQAGTVQNPLVMMRYLGEKNGAFTASMPIPGGSARISCKLPCDFIKIQGIYEGHVTATEIMPAAGTLGESVMSDAIAGNLKVYVKPQSHTRD